MRLKGPAFGIATSLLLIPPAAAQNFSNTIFFGDSATDSGWYLYKPLLTGIPPAPNGFGYAAPGGGTWTTNPDPGWAQVFAGKFGYSATPADAPGGGNNWAIGGARVVAGFYNTWSTQQQITAYLAGTGGVADPNALYTYWVGINDLQSYTSAFGPYPGNIVDPQNVAQISKLANQAVGQVAQLWNAGARYILVPNAFNFSSAAWTAIDAPTAFDPVLQSSRNLYDQLVWNGLAAQGINFIPADVAGLENYVLTHPAPFGITVTSIQTAACGSLNSYQCTAADLVTPNANKTYFFADGLSAPDGGGHPAATFQRIEADYFYSLVVAPSEISFLAEAPIQTRLGVVNTIQNQIPLSYSTPGSFHGWISGDVSSLKINNSSAGFPSDPGTPLAATAGFDYAITRDWLAGVAFSALTTTQSFSLGGNFSQTAYAASIYTAFRHDALWADAIATWGTLRNTVNRQIPLGVTTQSNQGSASGNNGSIAAEIGYNFIQSFGAPKPGLTYKAPTAAPVVLTHGPVVGVVLQQVYINGFTETNPSGAPTALSFGSQTRNSAISELGYQASVKMGLWEPYAKVVWGHEWGDLNRVVTEALTSVVAPSFTMPAVLLGRDFVSATAGTRIRLDDRLSGYGAVTAALGQNNVTVYGGQIGLNYALNPERLAAKY